MEKSSDSQRLSRREWLEQQARANAAEDTDPTPVEVPPFYTRPPTIKEDLQRYVRYEVSRAAQDSGFESFDEANDFGIETDDELDDWDSQYQLTPLQEEETIGYDNLEGVDDEKEIGERVDEGGVRGVRGGSDEGRERGASPVAGGGMAGRHADDQLDRNAGHRSAEIDGVRGPPRGGA